MGFLGLHCPTFLPGDSESQGSQSWNVGGVGWGAAVQPQGDNRVPSKQAQSMWSKGVGESRNGTGGLGWEPGAGLAGRGQEVGQEQWLVGNG